MSYEQIGARDTVLPELCLLVKFRVRVISSKLIKRVFPNLAGLYILIYDECSAYKNGRCDTVISGIWQRYIFS